MKATWREPFGSKWPPEPGGGGNVIGSAVFVRESAIAREPSPTFRKKKEER